MITIRGNETEIAVFSALMVKGKMGDCFTSVMLSNNGRPQKLYHAELLGIPVEFEIEKTPPGRKI
jgi:hypothetical protein